MKGPAIRFENVALKLGRTEILRDVNFTVEPGAVHALVGPNGGGKSSLIRALLGQAPHSGTISVEWESAPGVIGYVPQTLDFDRGLPMTVMDFMAVLTSHRPAFRAPSAECGEMALTALARVGMAEKAYRRVGALSGGELQRVLMAQGLIPEPALLVLDEPMAALDEAGAAIFETLIGELKAAGTTIVWIEHDLAAVRRIASRVTALNKTILFEGAPASELTAERVLTLFSHQAAPASLMRKVS